MHLSWHIRDIKIFVRLRYILLEVSTDSWVFASVDADHAKFIDLEALRRQRKCGSYYWCTFPSLRRSNNVNATT